MEDDAVYVDNDHVTALGKKVPKSIVWAKKVSYKTIIPLCGICNTNEKVVCGPYAFGKRYYMCCNSHFMESLSRSAKIVWRQSPPIYKEPSPLTMNKEALPSIEELTVFKKPLQSAIDKRKYYQQSTHIIETKRALAKELGYTERECEIIATTQSVRISQLRLRLKRQGCENRGFIQIPQAEFQAEPQAEPRAETMLATRSIGTQTELMVFVNTMTEENSDCVSCVIEDID